MKLCEAMSIIEHGRVGGFRVQYEYVDDRFRTYSCFPAVTTRPVEPEIESEEEAWRLAEQFAERAPAGYENITVTGSDNRPIDPSRVFRPRRRAGATPSIPTAPSDAP